jgi:hypothetical protein
MTKTHLAGFLALLLSAVIINSCKKDSSGSGGSSSAATRLTSYTMYQNTNLYESWVNIYTGNLLTGVTSKVYYNGYELHYKTTIDYINNRVSAITSYDSTASAWIKSYDIIVTSWSAEGFPSEIKNTYYEPSGYVDQQDITQFTYSSGQLKEKKLSYYRQGTLGLYQRTEYIYDQNARLVKEVTFNQDSSQYGTVDITWQNNLVVQTHLSIPAAYVNYKIVYTYSSGKLINDTQYEDDTPTVPEMTDEYSYDQNGCLVSKKNTIVASSEYDLLQYTYGVGQGNIREVFKIGGGYENWNGNPDPFPTKVRAGIPGFWFSVGANR